MKNFFLFETELPKDSGFELFQPCHLIWLFFIGVFIVITSFWYRRKDIFYQRKVNHIMGIIFPVIAIYRDTVLIVTGHFNVGFLPLHLCSMALWIATFYAWTENYYAGVIYVLLCIPGAAGALIFPNWRAYPFFHYMNIHDFISHGLIVAFGIWLFVSGKIVPKWRDLWITFVFGVVGFIILHKLNLVLETNYWFLNEPSSGSPMEWIIRITGSKWYLAGYFLFCAVIVVIWEGVLQVIHRIFKRKK